MDLIKICKINQKKDGHKTIIAHKRAPYQFTNEQYGIMGFMKLNGLSVNDLEKSSSQLGWEDNGKRILLSYANKNYDITVGKDRVKVKCSNDPSEHGNYSKSELSKEYRRYVKKLNNILDRIKNKPVTVNDLDNYQAPSISSPTVRTENKTAESTNVNLVGHTFHYEDFYETKILVGDNGEGEAGEWLANAQLSDADRDAAASKLKSLR